jgi:hypothetical protein
MHFFSNFDFLLLNDHDHEHRHKMARDILLGMSIQT